MKPTQIIGALLIIAGIAGLTFGSFSYTKETHEAKLGPVALSLTEKETVNIPLWASIIAIAAGSGMLFMNSRKD